MKTISCFKCAVGAMALIITACTSAPFEDISEAHIAKGLDREISLLAFSAGYVSPAQQVVATGYRPGTLTMGSPSGGSGYYSYVWQTYDGTGWVNIPGTASPTYRPPVLTATGSTPATYSYRCQVTSGMEVAYSNSAHVNVHTSAPGGSIHPATQTVRTGVVPAELNGSIADYIGYSEYTFQWQKSTNGSTWSDISGETGWFYQPASTYSRGTTYYRRKVMLNNLFAYSNTVTVIVN